MAKLINTRLPVKEILTGHLTCGQCAGLSVESLISGDVSSCSEQQMQKTSRACPKFQTDPSAIKDIMEEGDAADGFQEIASLVHSLDSRQLRAMAGALLNEITTRKQGYYMWQPVYVRYRGTARSNYMSNFMTCRIVNADKNTIRLISEDGQVVIRYPNTGLEGPSIYSKDAFEPIKQAMIEKGATVDPADKTTRNLLPLDVEDELNMPPASKRGGIASLDDVARTNRKIKKRRADDIVDLTHIAASIESGTADYARESEDGEVTLTPNTSYRRSGKKRNTEHELNDL